MIGKSSFVFIVEESLGDYMARHIDSDEFLKDIIRYFDTLINEKADWIEPNLVNIKNAVLRILDEQPTADVVEVKHGEWSVKSEDYRILTSQSSLSKLFHTNYLDR